MKIADVLEIICAFPSIVLEHIVALPGRIINDETEELKTDHDTE